METSSVDQSSTDVLTCTSEPASASVTKRRAIKVQRGSASAPVATQNKRTVPRALKLFGTGLSTVLEWQRNRAEHDVAIPFIVHQILSFLKLKGIYTSDCRMYN